MTSRGLMLAAGLLNISGIARLLGRRYAGAGTIFMLHSVVEAGRIFADPYMEVSAEFLEKSIRHLTARGIAIVSLDAALERLETGMPGPFVCFTFDDGYRNNLSVALPIFKRYGKPLTVFITTAVIQRRFDYGWACLREVIARHDRIDVEPLGRHFATATSRDKLKAYVEIHRQVRAGRIRHDALTQLFEHYGVSAEALQEKEGLSEADVHVMAREPLVEIGGHTDTHSPLSKLDAEEARRDMLRNKDYLERITDRPVRHFAYPYGNRTSCGPREFEMAVQSGFHTACTARAGALFHEHLNHRASLPRIPFGGNLQSLSILDCARRGVLTAALSRFGDPVVTD